MATKASPRLLASAILLAIGSVVLGTLSFVLFVLAIVRAFEAGHLGLDADAIVSLAFTGMLGAGCFCGTVALVELRRGDLRRAFRFAIAASLLPPLQMFATMGTLLLRTSREWGQMEVQAIPEPQLAPLWPPPPPK